MKSIEERAMEIDKIYQGDCIEVLKTFEDNSIDLTVTSPPYDNLRTYGGVIDGWSFEKFQGIAKELYRITKEGGVVVWVVADATIKGSETGTSFKQALYFMECGFNLHDTMIWNIGCVYTSKEEAEENKGNKESYVATVKIEWEE